MVRSFWKTGLVIIVLSGLWLRNVWVEDMEYKSDEWRMFQVTQTQAPISEWPTLGMQSGVALRNPGMSGWVFIAAAKIFRISTPLGLARFVQILNSLALIGLAAGLFASFRPRIRSRIHDHITGEDRTTWAWTLALTSVNPSLMILQRKIWAQSILPFFSLALLYFWWKREKRWAAFGLGFVGVLLGQIHMSGFFFLAALLLGLFFYARKETRWVPLLSGCSIAGISLLPWLKYLFTLSSNGPHLNPLSFQNLRSFRFWTVWATSSVGLDLRSSLGSNLNDFFECPRLLNGAPTYLCGAVSLGLAIAWFLVLGKAMNQCFQALQEADFKVSGRLKTISGKPTQLLLSGFVFYGLLMTALPFPFHRHYLLIAYPLTAYWLSRLAIRFWPGRAQMLLAGTVAAHLFLSTCFLLYIHQNGGATRGDYGVAYRLQTAPPSGTLGW